MDNKTLQGGTSWVIEIKVGFAREIGAYLDPFVGRRWLDERIDHWLTREAHPVFVLIGEPGIGKSAIACWLSQQRERLRPGSPIRERCPDERVRI